jgi:hypothetical protein
MSAKFKWSIGAAVVACLLFLLFFSPSPELQPSQSIIRSTELKSAQVRVQARLDRNRLEDDSQDLLLITVLDDGDQPLTGLHLSLIAPGFALDQSRLPCTADAAASTGQVSPHRSCEFQVALSPAARSGVYGIAAIVDWRRVDVTGRSTLLLSPVTIDRNWGAAQRGRLGRRVTAALKDLTLPIIIVVLGAFLNRRQNDRETERIKREKEAERLRLEADRERDQARIDAEKFANQQRIDADKDKEELQRLARSEQDERQQVLRLLLTRVMGLAQQHYLPFVSHAKLILIEAGKIQRGELDAEPDKVFLQVLFLLKRMEVFRLSKGGIFFKTRSGERAVSAAWILLKLNLYAAIGDIHTAAALKIVESDWDYHTYKTKLGELDEAWKQFESWLKQPEQSAGARGSFWQMLGTLDAFQAVMSYEADRVLSKHWYEEEGKLDFVLDAPTILYTKENVEPFAEKKTAILAEILQNVYQRGVSVVKL